MAVKLRRDKTVTPPEEDGQDFYESTRFWTAARAYGLNNLVLTWGSAVSLASAGGVIFLDDIGAGHIGRHQVGGELDALEHQPQSLRQGLDQQCFRSAGESGDQAVAADEERDHYLLEHLLLADDDAPHLLDDRRLDLAKSRDPLF